MSPATSADSVIPIKPLRRVARLQSAHHRTWPTRPAKPVLWVGARHRPHSAGQRSPCQLRAIVTIAQVRRKDVLQSAAVERGQQLCRLGVIHVSEAAGDALLERGWIVAVLEQVRVVVALYEQGFTAAQAQPDVRGRVTDIGEHTQSQCAVTEDELSRLTRIVRHRIGHNENISDCKCSVPLDQPKINLGIEQPLQPAVRPRGHPGGKRVFARETRYAADMIVVLMRDDDGGEVFRTNTETA